MDIGVWLESLAHECRTVTESSILTLILLKILGQIDISWWTVFLPFPIFLCVELLIVIVVVIIIKYGRKRKA